MNRVTIGMITTTMITAMESLYPIYPGGSNADNYPLDTSDNQSHLVGNQPPVAALCLLCQIQRFKIICIIFKREPIDGHIVDIMEVKS
jgi:hypothetical protein